LVQKVAQFNEHCTMKWAESPPD